MKSLKMQKGQSEAVNKRRRDNTMIQNTIRKTKYWTTRTPHKISDRILADSSHVIQCNALSSDEANDQSILYMLQFLFSNSSRTATVSSTLICLIKTCGCDNLIPSCYLKLGESILPLSTVILLDYGSVAFL